MGIHSDDKENMIGKTRGMVDTYLRKKSKEKPQQIIIASS